MDLHAVLAAAPFILDTVVWRHIWEREPRMAVRTLYDVLRSSFITCAMKQGAAGGGVAGCCQLLCVVFSAAGAWLAA